MKFKKYVDAITEALNLHKEQIDLLEKRLAEEQDKFRERVLSMAGVYTESYIEEFKKNYKLPMDFKAEMAKLSNVAMTEVTDNLEAIKRRLDAFFNAPVRQEFANKVNSIAITGLALTDREFRILKDSASSYLEMRLLNQLAESRSRMEKVVEIDKQTGTPERKNMKVANPFLGLEVPDIDEIYSAFESYSMNAKRFADSYCGENTGLKQFLDDVPIPLAVTADSYFRNKADESFLSVMEKAVTLLPKAEKKTLTEKDKKLIDTLIDPRYPNLAKDTARTLAESSPEIEELLKLDPRYREFLEEE